MASDRRMHILARLSAAQDAEAGASRLCDVSVDITGVSGAGVMLMSGDVQQGTLCSTDSVSAQIEDLQYMLGEGPCVDAYHLDRPVLEPDLVDPVTPRWVAFSGAAIEAGARATFGFPLQVGAVRLGAINLYRDRPGPLSDDQHADALAMAEVVAQAVLVMQSEAPPGKLATALEADANFRWIVHQASGMVSVQLGVSVAQALIRLRGYAFANDRLLTEVAEDVVARRLRFADSGDEREPAP